MTPAAKRTRVVSPLEDANEADTIGFDEAARVLDLPPNVLRLRLAHGDVAATVSGGQTRFRMADLSAFKQSLEKQRAAQRELADITEELMSVHDL